MKLRNKWIAALCVALVACMAAALPIPELPARAENSPTLFVDQPTLTLSVGETKTVLLTWKSTTGQLYYSWDDAAVIRFEKSSEWRGYTKELYITGLSAGKATVTITNSINDDKATIDVTVKSSEAEQQEIRDILGLSVKNANKRLLDRLKATRGGYSNGYVSVTLNGFKRIRDITVKAGKGRYMLFSVYPGMRFATAASKLKKLGWKQVKRSGDSCYYLNEDYLCRAICLQKKSNKVVAVRYYVP